MPEFTSDQVGFITGAANGIGLAVIHQLIKDGLTKIAALDVSASSLETAFASVPSNVKVLQLATDCAKEEEVEAAMKKTVEEFGRIDVCVNAAGISSVVGRRDRIDEMEKREVDGVLGVNLMGVWLCERAEIRQMLKQEMRDVNTGLPVKTRGAIVNLGSLTSHQAIPSLSPYIMAKHGVLGLTRADAHDYAKDGVRVNCICPGWIKTNLTKELHEGPISDEIMARVPMQRWGMPEEVALTICYLLSDRASFVTGASLHCDGGYNAC